MYSRQGLNTQHECVKVDRAQHPLHRDLPLFQIQMHFFRKNKRYFGYLTSCFYSTLFHWNRSYPQKRVFFFITIVLKSTLCPPVVTGTVSDIFVILILKTCISSTVSRMLISFSLYFQGNLIFFEETHGGTDDQVPHDQLLWRRMTYHSNLTLRFWCNRNL